MTSLSFSLDIPPKSLQFGGKRIRIVGSKRKPGKLVPMHFADSAATSFKRSVGLLAAPHRPKEPLTGPLVLRVVFVMPRPVALCTRKAPDGRIWCQSRPDNTNLVKGLEDILTAGRFWHDDNQVALSILLRQIARKGENSHIEVSITQLPEECDGQPFGINVQ